MHKTHVVLGLKHLSSFLQPGFTKLHFSFQSIALNFLWFPSNSCLSQQELTHQWGLLTPFFTAFTIPPHAAGQPLLLLPSSLLSQSFQWKFHKRISWSASSASGQKVWVFVCVPVLMATVILFSGLMGTKQVDSDPRLQQWPSCAARPEGQAE